MERPKLNQPRGVNLVVRMHTAISREWYGRQYSGNPNKLTIAKWSAHSECFNFS